MSACFKTHNGLRHGFLRRCVAHRFDLQGVAKPLSLFVETYRTEVGSLTADDITNVRKIEFDCRVGAIAVSLALHEAEDEEIGERMTNEFTALAPSSTKSSHQREDIQGGLEDLSSLITFQQVWTSKGRYDKSGLPRAHDTDHV